MGKRVSAVAALLAISFLGSLLALVLVGRNPLVGPSSDQVRTESLRQGLVGSPVTVNGDAPSSASSTITEAAEAVEAAVNTGIDVRPVEAAYRPGSRGVGDDGGGEATTDAPPSAEEGGVVAKTTDATEEAEKAKDQAESAAEKAAAEAERAAEKAKNETEKAAEKAKNETEKAAEKAKGAAEKQADKAKGAAEKQADKAKKGKD